MQEATGVRGRQGAASLAERISGGPIAARDDALVAERLGELGEAFAALDEPPGAAGLMDRPQVRALIAGVLAGSPYLSGLMLRDPGRLARILLTDPAASVVDALERVRAAGTAVKTTPELMTVLRQAKAEVALITALADLGEVWRVADVTGALSELADTTLARAVDHLFAQAITRGDWLPPDRPGEGAAANSGYFVLAMGKYGARELNYSSDIDLIVFFDPAKARLRGGLEPLTFYIRLTRELVRLMQERTGEGYVFRTDLRLRPDAGATPIAISRDAAAYYYESFGQNWERAALIKARTVAGDIGEGNDFLAELAPFVWRRYLDFAAIADVHAMKRQIHAFRGFGGIGIAGHNIKLGRGGIREIEFFVQTQQLIAGGRQADLRVASTIAALGRLAERGWIDGATRDELGQAYEQLRRIEHRLQMTADEQTHELPGEGAELERLARFAGFGDVAALAGHLTPVMECVERHYAALFEDMPDLTPAGANMVFAGEADDPTTLEVLARLGYSQPSQVLAIVRGWHHGRYPAVRTARARERLTEVQPLLIEALAANASPDAALAGFDRFLSQLPAGVQLFSLLRANPRLLALIADIMGNAPRLAGILGRRSRLLDAVLDPRVIGTLPTQEELDDLVARELGGAHDLQDVLDRARAVGGEQGFLIGVRLLTGAIGARRAGNTYAMLAEALIRGLMAAVEADFHRAHGRVPGGSAAIVAMGKLGGREMTATSDLDLIAVYDFDPASEQSDGARPLPPIQYYARLTQRFISALTAPTAEGRLYEVDMRLRPSGNQGPVATQLSSFVDYQTREAWTWEHLALTRARVVSGPPAVREKVEAAIRASLIRPRDVAKTAADVRDMRERVFAEKGSPSIWELKQARGGLVDLEFVVQFLQLSHAATNPNVLDTNTLGAIDRLEAAGILDDEAAASLTRSARLLHDLTQILRLCVDGPFNPEACPDGLKRLLVRVGDAPDFAGLERQLSACMAETAGLFDRLVR